MSIQIPVVTTNPVPCFRDIMDNTVVAWVNGKSLKAPAGTIYIFEHQYTKYGKRPHESVSADEMLRVGRTVNGK